MKLIISHSQTKRTIDGDFEICGSADDLERLVKKFKKKIREKDFSYGWIKIGKDAPVFADTAPGHWDSTADEIQGDKIRRLQEYSESLEDKIRRLQEYREDQEASQVTLAALIKEVQP